MVMLVRNTDESTRKRVVEVARHMLGKPFGIHPDGSETNGEIYCTQLALQAWQVAGITLTQARDQIDIPFIRGKYLLPDTLARSSWLVELKPKNGSVLTQGQPQMSYEYSSHRIRASIFRIPTKLKTSFT